MMIRILFASAMLLAVAGARPAAAETITWGSCVTNMVGSGIAVDVKFFKTTDITFAKVATSNGAALQYTTTAGPVYHEPSLLSARSYCIGDGGTYVAVVSVKGGKLVSVLIDTAIAVAVGAAAAASCPETAGATCVIAAGAIAGTGSLATNLAPPAFGLFTIWTLAPGRSLEVWGGATDPKEAGATTDKAVICNSDVQGYACVKNNGDKGVCGMDGISGACKN